MPTRPSPARDRILRIVRQCPQLTADQIAVAAGCHRSTVHEHLADRHRATVHNQTHSNIRGRPAVLLADVSAKRRAAESRSVAPVPLARLAGDPDKGARRQVAANESTGTYMPE